MPTTPIGGLRYPALSDNPNGPLAVQNLAEDVADQLPGLRYANAAARDAAITSPDDGMTVWLDTPGAYFDRIDGAWVQRTNNAGTQSVMAGTAPPTGTPLLVKTLFGFLVTDASGDYTVTLPGGAYANGLVAVFAQVAALSPVDWKATAFTLSTVTLRIYNTASGASAGALSVRTSFTAWGW